jgi:hypothetical protein
MIFWLDEGFKGAGYRPFGSFRKANLDASHQKAASKKYGRREMKRCSCS